MFDSTTAKQWLDSLRRGIRSGWKSTASLVHSGVTPPLVVQALLLTMVTYGLLNSWFLHCVEHSYRNATLDELSAATTPDERLERVCELARAKPSLKTHPLLRAVFQAEAPASEQYRQLIEGIASGEDGADARTALIHDQVTGNLGGWRLLVLSAEPHSGAELLNAVVRSDPLWQHKLDSQKEQAQDLREFLVGFGDLVAQLVRPDIRNLQRINGWIQWWTVFLTWVVLIAAFHRAVLLAWLDSRGWFAPHPTGYSTLPVSYRLLKGLEAYWPGRRGAASDVGGDPRANVAIPPLYDGAAQASDFGEHRRVPDLLDRQVYGPLSFILGLLPSLGFIGTVYGMGDALLSADGLFQAQDKGAAISRITTHLGFAFDTTLVALLAGILASATVVRLRVWENRLWHAADQHSATAARDRSQSARPPA